MKELTITTNQLIQRPTLYTIKQNGHFTCNISHLNRMCAKINKDPGRVYDIVKAYDGEADSFTRETIFSYIAYKYRNGKYDSVYSQWLNAEV